VTMREDFVPESPNGALIVGDYRYLLWRSFDSLLPGKTIAWVMLNPSTADETNPDPTLTRCVNYAKAWGYGRLEVVNLFALRDKDPTQLLYREDPVGPDNDAYLRRAVARAPTVVCAWGAPQNTKVGRMATRRADELWESVLQYHPNTVCLGTCGLSAGYRNVPEPRHPLYLRKNLTPEPYRRAL